MPKPILIGPACATARVAASAGEMRAAPMPVFTARRLTLLVMNFPPEGVLEFRTRWSSCFDNRGAVRVEHDVTVSAGECPALALMKRERRGAWQCAQGDLAHCPLCLFSWRMSIRGAGPKPCERLRTH